MSDLDNPDKNLADAAPEEEVLLDINGNPIPRNWNPGQAPPPADAPSSTAPPPKARPAYQVRPTPSPLSPPSLGASLYGGLSTGEEEVKYDLAGNPLPSSRPAGQSAGPGGGYAPPFPGYGAPLSGGPPRPGSWPPPPGGSVYGAPGGYAPRGGEANTSGMRQGVPPSVASLKWNWAAFLGGTSLWWCFFNGSPLWGGILLALVLISWIPFLGAVAGVTYFGIAVFLGINGHKLAWEGRRFEGGYSQFIEVQRIWLKWAVGLIIANFLLIPILAAILFPVYQKLRMQQDRAHLGGYGSPRGNRDYRPYANGTHRPHGSTPSHTGSGYGRPLPRPKDPFAHPSP